MVEIIMKKILFFVCLTIFNMSLLMAEDCRVCYGQFITIEKYNDLLKHKETFKSKNNAEELPSVYHNVYNLTFINILDFFVLYKDHNGQIKCNINERDYMVDNYAEKNNQIFFDLYSTYANSEEIEFEDSIILKRINERTFEFLSKEKSFFHLKKMICVAAPPAIPLEYAELNDTRVRVRTEPNLSCDTWGYVNKNDLVIIKDKSSDKFEIDGEAWYWYKIESEYLPDGWVYGKYLNKISKEDYEKKIDLKNKPPVTEQKLSKLEIIQSVSDVSSILRSEAKRNRDDKKNVVYSELKKMYRNYGTSYDGKKDILEITDNRYSYNHNLKIGMSKNEIVVLLGEPDEEQNNKIIYRDKFGRLYLYTLILYIKKDSLEKIELKRENLQF